MSPPSSAKSPRLQATLNLPQIVALYIGSVIGSGILLVPGLTAEMAGPASIVAWLLMSVLVIPMAITMGLLAAKHPSSGGVSHFVRLAYGRKAGQLVGWFFLLSVPIGGPVVAVTGAQYVGVLLHWGDLQTYAAASLILIIPLVMNVFGLHLAGSVQTIVITLIVAILLLAIVAGMPHASSANFTPFMPRGAMSVFQAAGLMFWCFIGWEAVTHLSAEFVDPRKNAIRGVLWSAGIVSALYFAVAFMTIATHSYGGAGSAAALSVLVQRSLGPVGGWIVAVTAIFICFAAFNAYASAGSRIAYAMAQAGEAPKWLGTLHRKYNTPIGGLAFVAVGIAFSMAALLFKTVSLSQLIALPNATFMATYIGGCLAGTRLLRDTRVGRSSSWISLVVTLGLYPFLGWPALYPLAIGILFMLWSRRRSLSARHSGRPPMRPPQ
ncbi:L-methionine/branched-chain amino acid exporter YjeH [Paenibacillus solanacearum]|uniref:L-methionine/branched-chain amino acid exporter YjeH n=1 Tax=Paenibacillus solanacearum TaxID=2048548 RepID=A0A916K130_9BACL|nr:amino acid permease [Paenibacillus solanacearum]CAG7619069.1 L-methionine/branched-chain amino acid exporter YjeH [Paenibacillus solanacearum]